VSPSKTEAVSRAESGARRAESDARRAETHPAAQRLASVGVVSRAAIYVVLAALTLEIAIRGRSSSQADTQGVFSEIARQPDGKALLALLGLGLALYAGWRFLQVLSGKPSPGAKGALTRFGWFCSGVLYIALCVDAFKLLFGSASNNSPSQHPSSFAATVLRWPLGPFLLGVIGFGVAVGGITLIVWGFVHDYGNVLDRSRMTSRKFAVARTTGILGDVARGVAILLVAASLVSSAISNDPQHSKSLGAALQSAINVRGGPELIGLLAGGLLCFSAYTVMEAIYRRR
jgi:hypothetical protein